LLATPGRQREGDRPELQVERQFIHGSPGLRMMERSTRRSLPCTAIGDRMRQKPFNLTF
jgi:hypothetical protein